MIGVAGRGLDGAELGVVQDIYRVAENEVYIVGGGAVRRPSTCRRSGVHPDLRAASRRDRRRRRGPRPPSRPRSAEPTPTGRVRRADVAQRRRPRRRQARRPSRPPIRAGADAAGAPAREASADTARPPGRRRHDPRDRRPDAVPGDGRRAAVARASPDGSRNEAWPRSGSTTCASGARAAIDRSTTRRTAAAPGWSCAWSRSSRPSRRSAGQTRRSSCSTRAARCSARLAPPTSRRRAHLVFVCPRYEGVDERIRAFVDLELSIGDYVLTGGELPALVVIDAVIRLLPGAIDDLSTAEESFSGGLLEYPQYTRPPSFRGMDVPDDPRPRATTAPSPAGARSRRPPAPASTVPTCCRRPKRASCAMDAGTAESLLELAEAGQRRRHRIRMQALAGAARGTPGRPAGGDRLVRRRRADGRGASPGELPVSVLDHEAAVRGGRRLVRSRARRAGRRRPPSRQGRRCMRGSCRSGSATTCARRSCSVRRWRSPDGSAIAPLISQALGGLARVALRTDVPRAGGSPVRRSP